MSKQIVVQGVNGEVTVQSAVSGFESEKALQELIARCPELLPTKDFGPDYADPITVGVECVTSEGRIDVLLLTPAGRTVVVETKLAKNPEQRREVIAQTMSYVVGFPTSYETLERWHRDYHGPAAPSIWEKVADASDADSEDQFRAEVEDALAARRMAALIVGDRFPKLGRLLRMAHALDEVVATGARFGVAAVRRFPLPSPEGAAVVTSEMLGKTVIERRTEIAVTVLDSDGSTVRTKLESVKIAERAEQRTPNRPGETKPIAVDGFRDLLKTAGMGALWTEVLGPLSEKTYSLEGTPKMLAIRLPVGEVEVKCGLVRQDGTILTGRGIGGALERAEADPSTYGWWLAELQAAFPGAVRNDTARVGIKLDRAAWEGEEEKLRELFEGLAERLKQVLPTE